MTRYGSRSRSNKQQEDEEDGPIKAKEPTKKTERGYKVSFFHSIQRTSLFFFKLTYETLPLVIRVAASSPPLVLRRSDLATSFLSLRRVPPPPLPPPAPPGCGLPRLLLFLLLLLPLALLLLSAVAPLPPPLAPAPRELLTLVELPLPLPWLPKLDSPCSGVG